jgi:amino acid permease
MEYKAIVSKFFSMADIFFTTIAILLQKNVRTFKEGSDLATFVVVMTYFSLKIFFLLTAEGEKSRKIQNEEKFFNDYKDDLEEYIKNKKKNE